ncbi:hypothetical protein [Kaistella antarctica]|nr:hypothetical protein [Kaistella antarctica]SEV80968.1 hypothetical protein SAMN05421765_0198 [Kaistella antarctica]VEI00239.1 Uncharacterised protein [Kaistella antarctica]
MNRSLGFLLLFVLLYNCEKSKKNIYDLKPDKEYYYLLKENGDSIKIKTEPYRLNYSKPKFLIISRFNDNMKKFEVDCVLLKVKDKYYNYFNLDKKDSIDENSFVFLSKDPQIIENIIDTTGINYWKKGTEIYKMEGNGIYSRHLFFTNPTRYVLDFGKYYYDKDYKIYKIEETVRGNKITYK